MSNYFPMHEGAQKKQTSYFLHEHSGDCPYRHDYAPSNGCNCFNYESPSVSRNLHPISKEEAEAIRRGLEDIRAGRVTKTLVRRTGKLYGFVSEEQTLIDPDPGYTYAEWAAYLDGLLQGLKAAERHNDGET